MGFFFFFAAFGSGVSTALHIGQDRDCLPSAFSCSCPNHVFIHDLWNSWLQQRMLYVIGRPIARFFPSGVDVSCCERLGGMRFVGGELVAGSLVCLVFFWLIFWTGNDL